METFHKEINEWVELYSQPLLNRALSLVANKEDAMNIVKEVFVAQEFAADLAAKHSQEQSGRLLPRPLSKADDEHERLL